ncbi:hypothetical protein [Streptomyces sp. NPDC020917]|uniref:hypothetical protein n=1 Tax=Streptomyces sp. NPDC020917 TaxID=3365102 RepID=UPI0037B1FC22
MVPYEAGFARIDITPPIGTSGQTNEDGDRQIVGVHWPLNARVAIIRHGAEAVMFVSCDLIALAGDTVASIRESIADRTGFPGERVVVSCTHTHSSARTVQVWAGEIDEPFLHGLPVKIGDAAAEALARAEPVTLRVGSARTYGLTFNRRPLYAGGEVGNEGPQWVDDFERMEGPADETLQVLFAERADGTVVGGLANFAVHPHMFGLEPIYSADIAGAFVTKLGAAYDAEFLFLQGAGGNLYWRDMSAPPFWTVEGGAADPGSMRTVAPWGHREMGEWGPIALSDRWSNALVEAAVVAMDAAREIADAVVVVSTGWLSLPQRKAAAKHVEAARWFLEQDRKSVDMDAYNLRATGHRYTFFDNRFLQAGFSEQIIEIDRAQREAPGREVLEEAEIMAIRVGDVGFATYPAEIFSELGFETKDGSPFDYTFVIELANGWVGYVPTECAFSHGGYETRLGTVSRLVPEAGGRMTALAIERLKALADKEPS